MSETKATPVLAHRIHPSVTVDRVLEAVESDDNLGFCVACGTDVFSVEPDARRYKCEACGELAVFGAEELLFRIA